MGYMNKLKKSHFTTNIFTENLRLIEFVYFFIFFMYDLNYIDNSK